MPESLASLSLSLRLLIRRDGCFRGIVFVGKFQFDPFVSIFFVMMGKSDDNHGSQDSEADFENDGRGDDMKQARHEFAERSRQKASTPESDDACDHAENDQESTAELSEVVHVVVDVIRVIFE